jgi:hypothetical protein
MKIYVLLENITNWDSAMIECLKFFKEIDKKFASYLFNKYFKSDALFNKINWSKTFFPGKLLINYSN